MKKTIYGAVAVFLATFSLLSWQVGSGHDPALNNPAIALVSSTTGPKAAQTKTSGGGSHATKPTAAHHHGAKPARTASSGGGGGKHRERESD